MSHTTRPQAISLSTSTLNLKSVGVRATQGSDLRVEGRA